LLRGLLAKIYKMAGLEVWKSACPWIKLRTKTMGCVELADMPHGREGATEWPPSNLGASFPF